MADSGWFAARPSGTEDIYKIYGESFPQPGPSAPRAGGGAGQVVDMKFCQAPCERLDVWGGIPSESDGGSAATEVPHTRGDNRETIACSNPGSATMKTASSP